MINITSTEEDKMNIQQIENDIAAYKKALKDIDIPEKERLEQKYPVKSKYKDGVPQSAVDVMIDMIMAIDSNYELNA